MTLNDLNLLLDEDLSRMTRDTSHAVLHVAINWGQMSESTAATRERVRVDLRDHFSRRLSAGDELAELEGCQFAILLHATSETSVLQMARLLRALFQQIAPAGGAGSLAIGALLFGSDQHHSKDLLRSASWHSMKAQAKVGNRIEYADLRSSCKTWQVPRKRRTL